jgi:hypothetical protein
MLNKFQNVQVSDTSKTNNMITASPKVGDTIWFAEYKRPYKVIACDARFIICTRPFMKTVLYTIVDLVQNIRGTENLIFCMGFGTTELCNEALERLQKNESEVSHRNRVALNITKIKSSNSDHSSKADKYQMT